MVMLATTTPDDGLDGYTEHFGGAVTYDTPEEHAEQAADVAKVEWLNKQVPKWQRDLDRAHSQIHAGNPDWPALADAQVKLNGVKLKLADANDIIDEADRDRGQPLKKVITGVLVQRMRAQNGGQFPQPTARQLSPAPNAPPIPKPTTSKWKVFLEIVIWIAVAAFVIVMGALFGAPLAAFLGAIVIVLAILRATGVNPVSSVMGGGTGGVFENISQATGSIALIVLIGAGLYVFSKIK